MHTAHCKNSKCSSSFMESCDGMDNFYHCKKIWERFQTVEKLNKDLGAVRCVPPPSSLPEDMSVMLLKL